jgi:hypothetical protein
MEEIAGVVVDTSEAWLGDAGFGAISADVPAEEVVLAIGDDATCPSALPAKAAAPTRAAKMKRRVKSIVVSGLIPHRFRIQYRNFGLL